MVGRKNTNLKLVKQPPEDGRWFPSLRAYEIPDQETLALEWEARIAELHRAPNRRRVVIYRTLPCDLSAKDREELAERMAKADERKEDLENEIKGLQEQTKELKKEIESADDAIREARKDLRRGKVDRSVRVEQVFDYDEGKVTYLRTDTGHVVETRKMTDDERQTALQFPLE